MKSKFFTLFAAFTLLFGANVMAQELTSGEFIVNGIKRVAVGVCARFDFNKHDAIAFHGNDVKFVVTYAKISFTNGISKCD